MHELCKGNAKRLFGNLGENEICGDFLGQARLYVTANAPSGTLFCRTTE